MMTTLFGELVPAESCTRAEIIGIINAYHFCLPERRYHLDHLFLQLKQSERGKRLCRKSSARRDYGSRLVHRIGTSLNKNLQYFPEGMNSTSAKWKLIAGTIVLLVIALGFNALLSSGSLKKLYEESVVSEYRAIGKGLQGNIEESLYVGENIREFPEMGRILEETKERIVREVSVGNGVSVSVALPDGSIRYSTDKDLLDATLPEQARFNYENAEGEKKSSLKSHYAKYENTCITALPVRNGEKKWEGTVIIAFDEKRVRELHDAVFSKNVKTILIIVIIGAFLLTLFKLMILKETPVEKFPKRKVYISIFSIVILSQIVLSGLNINELKNHYLQVNHQETVVPDTGVSEKMFSPQLKEIVLDSATVLIISIFFFGEMLILFFQLVERRFSRTRQRTIFLYSSHQLKNF